MQSTGFGKTKRNQRIMLAIRYLPDSDVDPSLDQALRNLFSTCFTGPNSHVFAKRRYFNDPPLHRWIIRDSDELLIAHTAAHEKVIIFEDREIPICGVAEVSVHPSYRRKGFVREMIKEVHQFMRSKNLKFSALSGETEIYQSSGYRKINNLVYTNNGKIEPFPKAMVFELLNEPWPKEEVYLVGKFF